MINDVLLPFLLCFEKIYIINSTFSWQEEVIIFEPFAFDIIKQALKIKYSVFLNNNH